MKTPLRKRIGVKERPASRERGWLFMAILGLIGIFGAIGLAAIGFNAPNSIPGRSYYKVKGEFQHADNLTAHYQIREGGKLVGQVLDPRVNSKGNAVIDMQLDPSVKPLKSDTRLEVRPRSPVGVRYVDIIPGENGRDLKDGETIPATQTKSTVQLDTVLGTFDPQTRQRFRDFFGGLGGGFAGRGGDVNDALAAFPQMLQDSRVVLGTIADHPGSVRSFVRGAGTIAAASAPVREQIANGFKPESDAMKPFVESRSEVQQTFEDAPPALDTAASRLPNVDALLGEVSGFARNVRPVLHAAPRSFGQTRALLVESRPGLRNAKKTLSLARRAVNPTLSLLKTVNPVLPNIDNTLAPSTPIVEKFGAHGCDILQFGNNWSSMMSYGVNGDDKLGVLRFNVVAPAPEGAFFGLTKKSVGNVPSSPYPAPCTAGHEAVPANGK